MTSTASSNSNRPTGIGQPPPSPTDMSVKVGGRLFQPALPVVDGAPPNELERRFQATLDVFIQNGAIPLETKKGIQTRERVLNQIKRMSRDWIRYVCLQKGLPMDVVDAAGGQLFTSGSYRLGVHEPGADIDTILVVPSVVRRQDFFGTISGGGSSTEQQQRDPNSLAERIRRHADVTNFVPVEGAAVPLLTFDWEGVNIDLLFARLNANSVPADFDIDNDAVLDGVDSATEKSLNGPRVTNLIAHFVNGTPARYQAFLTVVRCVRKWAKARGLYSNKMGYFGGVNINIAVAQTIQLYPNACPSSLLRKFFLVFKTWRWPQPVMLTKPHDADYGLAVWSAQTAARQVAPMITPAYPAMNSTLAVSRQTLQILQEEFNRGHEIVDKCWKSFQQNPNAPPDSEVYQNAWKALFRPSDFFIAYPNYMSLCIVGPSQAEAQAWAGFVESRLRKLVSDLLARSLPLKKIQLWPKKINACVADPNALLTPTQRRNCLTYFVGFYVDKLRMRGEQLNAEIAMQNFREWELARFQPLIPGMDVLVKTFKVKELPLICFDGMYDGGKTEAMKRRRELRNNDPVRQEKKRVQRLEELKAKMAEIQRKKEEQQDKKRKREEVELEQDEEELGKEEVVKQEEKSATAEGLDDAEERVEEANEESNLLESAFDTMNEGKTREEAAADREKLLAGELLVRQGANGKADDDADVASVESEEEAGYTGDGARLSYFGQAQQHQLTDKRCLPASVEEAEVLRKLGYSIVTDDESKILGAGMLPPWHSSVEELQEAKRQREEQKQMRMRIKFRTKFDIVELDTNGYVIDQGDDDFMPSNSWKGRRAGFEYKLAERGLGYYRTGKKVVVPSNTAY